MAKTEMIRARIEPEVKQAVEAMLTSFGLTHTDFVGLIYRYAVEHDELPISITLRPEFNAWLGKQLANNKSKRSKK